MQKPVVTRWPYNGNVHGLPGQYYSMGINPYYAPHMQYQGGGAISPKGWKNDQDYAKLLFENPLQQGEFSPYGQIHPLQPMNPYPAQAFALKPPTGMQSIMNSFKTAEGTLDFNKMMDTAGQMMSAVNQVSSLVKGLGGILKA
ncbi:YppG family protein [Bacillus massilinigeriensis]|uniref:YppG family protein n=1 Tax=Bacillus mediterraneensis TaxID=1805474 RepID=UPI00093DB76A